jgi:hypothetical protein
VQRLPKNGLPQSWIWLKLHGAVLQNGGSLPGLGATDELFPMGANQICGSHGGETIGLLEIATASCAEVQVNAQGVPPLNEKLTDELIRLPSSPCLIG